MLENEILTVGVFVLCISFVAEYVDSTLGMGYGTSLTPILLLLGYDPSQIVPAVLLSELFTGVLAGVAHHKAGNVSFHHSGSRVSRAFAALNKTGVSGFLRRVLSQHMKVALLIASCSIVGTLIAVFVAGTMSKFYLKLYIGLMVLGMGVVILMKRKSNTPFSWKKITILGLIASFNKGMSGGGYGPVVTSGQILSGVQGKNAVAITSLAEGLTCAVGFAAYFLLVGITDWVLFPYLCIGSLLSVPLSAITLKRLSNERMKLIIGVSTTILGGLTLVKLF